MWVNIHNVGQNKKKAEKVKFSITAYVIFSIIIVINNVNNSFLNEKFC